MNWDKIFEKIEFDVKVDNLEDVFQRFQKYIHEDDNEYTLDGYTLQTYMMSEKINETDAEVPATRGTRHPSNHAQRRKATEHQKRQLGAKYRFSAEPIDAYWIEEVRDDDDNVRKVTHWLFDTHKEVYGMSTEEYYEFLKSIPWDKVKACNVKQSWGGKSLSKKIDNRKRRHQRIEEREGAEPFNPWYDPDYIDDIEYETDLDIPVGTGYWSDEELSEAINNYKDPFYDPYDCDDYDDELEEVLVDDDDEDFCLDVDGGNFYTHETALQKHCEELKEEVKKLHDFLNEYNLNTLFSQWEKNNNR